MSQDRAMQQEPLLPDRNKQHDIFICNFLDSIPKDDMGSMEHPMFSLSTKPDRRIRHYEHSGNTVTIAPGAYGLATIMDKDILIYCISKLVAAINQGKDISKTVRLTAYDLLVSTNRLTDGDSYQRLKSAFERLAGTRITTSIDTNGKRIDEGFGIIDRWKIVRETTSGRMEAVEVTLSEWLYNAVLGKEVLTISRDYFRLRKPIERRLYELARKHCGNQKQWTVGLKILHKKTGTSTTFKDFRQKIKRAVTTDHLPDYRIALDSADNVIFTKREDDKPKVQVQVRRGPRLRTNTYLKAKKAAPGFDVYYLEQEWIDWWYKSGEPELKTPDGAFINFCKKRYAQQFRP